MIVKEPWFPPVDSALQERFHAEGLALVGVADAQRAHELSEEYNQWIAQGMHGTMQWMEKHRPLKYNPAEFFPGCQSILFAAINYYQKGSTPPQEPSGRVARYAWGRDYHKELGNRLRRVSRALQVQYPGETFRSWTDATPLAERHYAERAGIGFTGRHTLLISGQYGSWFLLGEVLSTKHWGPTAQVQPLHGGCPRTCRRCIDICPTGALLGPHRIDARRCISYLTIEHRGSIPRELRPAIGEWLFGCDLCQETCPLNVRATTTDVAAFLKPIAGERVLLKEILQLPSRDAFVSRFAGSPLMRPGREGLIRNACIVAGNMRYRSLLPELHVVASDDDPILSEHARWAMDCIARTD